MSTLTLQIDNRKANLLELTDKEKSQLLKDCYNQDVRFKKRYGNIDFVNIDMPGYSAKFRDQITRLLFKNNIINQNIELEKLHTVLSEEMREYNFDYGVNKVSTYFYDTDDEFMELYYSFLRNVILKEFPEEFYFQAIPTIRIHCPDAKNSDHYPRYHSDIFYGHPHEEINIWFPLTNIVDNHGFSICDLSNSRNFIAQYNFDRDVFTDNTINNKAFSNQMENLAQQVTTNYGQVMLFDPRCIHSGHPMGTHTRISIDVRIILKKDFEELPIDYQGSGRRKVLFAPGCCYHAKLIQEI